MGEYLMQKYFVHHQGKQTGPWPVPEILQKLENKELLWTDYVYDTTTLDWVF